jgi:hypothetical protein
MRDASPAGKIWPRLDCIHSGNLLVMEVASSFSALRQPPSRFKPVFLCVRQVLSLLLSLTLWLPGLGLAQQPQRLELLVVAGEGAVNSIETRAVTVPVVELRDEQQRPIAGAEVVFSAPPVGPSVTFFGAARSLSVRTDERGRAQPDGVMPNTLPGEFAIDVIAAYAGLQAPAVIRQSNALEPAPPGKKKRILGWRTWIAIGAAVAAVAVGLSRRDSSPASPANIPNGSATP